MKIVLWVFVLLLAFPLSLSAETRAKRARYSANFSYAGDRPLPRARTAKKKRKRLKRYSMMNRRPAGIYRHSSLAQKQRKKKRDQNELWLNVSAGFGSSNGNFGAQNINATTPALEMGAEAWWSYVGLELFGSFLFSGAQASEQDSSFENAATTVGFLGASLKGRYPLKLSRETTLVPIFGLGGGHVSHEYVRNTSSARLREASHVTSLNALLGFGLRFFQSRFILSADALIPLATTGSREADGVQENVGTERDRLFRARVSAKFRVSERLYVGVRHTRLDHSTRGHKGPDVRLNLATFQLGF